MFVRNIKLVLPLALFVVLAGCDSNPVFGKNGNFRLKDAGPDEFAILPTKELEQPEDYENLPVPTLGSKNRVDLTPKSDAVVALGGKAEKLDSGRIGAGEQALVTAASRNGVSPDIREQLAEEDAAYRKKHRAKFIQKWYPDRSYLKRHEKESLKSYDELNRLRALGVRTPSVPAQQN